MFKSLLSKLKLENSLIEGVKKVPEKISDWTTEKINALDKPVAKEISQNSTRFKDSENYIAELDKSVTEEIKTPYSKEVNDHISSLKELEIYEKAGLEEKTINGRTALIKTDINWEQKDEFGRTNLERVKNGNPPIASNGEIIELHHIGQKPDSPFAELTRSEHRGKGNDTILHDKTKVSEIDRTAFQKERQEHWQNRA